MTSIIDLHHDYLLITKMTVPVNRKIRLLSELFGETENPWRVIGITRAALNIFKENGFNKVKRMGINRAHLVDRKTSHKYMLENVFKEPDDWWEYYYENDKTILATSSENMSSSFSEIYYFENNDQLFKSSGFNWSYRKKKEKVFLEKLVNTNET